jgi:hypothetical protein
MRNLPYYIRRGVCDVSAFRACVIHYGCNDITDKVSREDCANSIVCSLDRVVTTIRKINPSITLGVSGILPRPRDFKEIYFPNVRLQEACIFTNVALRMFCDTTGISYFTSENFLKGLESEGEMYRIEDGIHLNYIGAWHFQNYMEGKVGLLLGPSPPLHTPPPILPPTSSRPRRRRRRRRCPLNRPVVL